MTSQQELVDRTFTMWRSMLPDRPDVTIDEFRAGYDSMFADFPVDPEARIEEVDAGGVRSLQVRIGDATPDRHVVYFHGGGYMCGNPEGVKGTAALLARAAQASVLVPDYRLAPEHAYPAALDDATAACRWLLDNGVGAGKLSLVGDSAGGGLAVATTKKLLDSGAQPAAVVGWSPWVDMEVTGSTITSNAEIDPIASGQSLTMSAQAYLQGHDPRDPGACSLLTDFAGFPPMLIQVGTVEVLLDDSRRLAANARAAGVDVSLEEAEGLPHVYQYFASFLPEAKASIDRTGAFIVKHSA